MIKNKKKIKPQLIYGRVLSILEMNLVFEQVPNDTLFEWTVNVNIECE